MEQLMGQIYQQIEMEIQIVHIFSTELMIILT